MSCGYSSTGSRFRIFAKSNGPLKVGTVAVQGNGKQNAPTAKAWHLIQERTLRRKTETILQRIHTLPTESSTYQVLRPEQAKALFQVLSKWESDQGKQNSKRTRSPAENGSCKASQASALTAWEIHHTHLQES